MAFKDGLFDSFDSVLVYLRQCVHNKSIYVLTKLTFYSGLKRQIPDNSPDVKINDGLAAELVLTREEVNVDGPNLLEGDVTFRRMGLYTK